MIFISRKCCVCAGEKQVPLKVITEQQRKMIFMKRGIFVPPGNRCCSVHIYNDHLSFEALQLIKPSTADVVYLNTKAVIELLDDCAHLIRSTKTFDFDDPSSLDENSYYAITGLKKGKRFVFELVSTFSILNLISDHFNHLLSTVSSLRNSSIRSTRVALAVFLAKMRLGMSNTVLASLFHLKDKRTVARIIQNVAQALQKDFVPYHLGLQHIDRATVVKKHQTSIASELMTDGDDQAIIVMDGTYLYVQKSSNNSFQRRSFSMHKYRNLIKPMIVTATVSNRNVTTDKEF